MIVSEVLWLAHEGVRGRAVRCDLSLSCYIHIHHATDYTAIVQLDGAER